MVKGGKLSWYALGSSLMSASLVLSASICFYIFSNAQNAHAKLRPRILESSAFRSANGKTYLVLRTGTLIGEDRVRITTMYGTALSGASTGSNGTNCADTVTAAVGVVGLSTLFDDGSGPLNSCFKSALIGTTDIPTFDPCANSGNGELTFAGPVTVTIGGMTAIGIGTVDVPAASQSGPFVQDVIFFNDAYMFGVVQPTTATTLCAPVPSDGFDLPLGKSIVFAWNTGLVGFDLGVAGFYMDDDGIGSAICNSGNPVGCQSGVIGSARLAVSDLPFSGSVDCPAVCQCPESNSLGCISGTVIYAPNGQPHPGMTVRLRKLSPRPRVKMEVTADSNGCYRFTDLEDGRYIMKLNGCEGSGKRTVVITNGGKVNNKNIMWRHNRRHTRCFFWLSN